ncbi:hypothetical protein [Deinococcus petrolearius]|uniref:Uncharacterized protein n=1 Tax=Deinococcus petrolearius TaxID=1751295 RepID=A0ABW1DKC8_9DEIO
MERFGDLAAASGKDEKKGGKKARKALKKLKKKARRALLPEPAGRRGETTERVEAVYIRKETVRAVWREVKKDGGESVSELVEDLLLRWLRERA